jgi:predicted flap endonuclease-1-like 5' DNA nuclease
MTTTNLIIIALLLLGLACYVYIFFAAQRLQRRRAERVRDGAEAPAAPADGPVPAAPQAPSAAPADAPSPFLAAADGAADDLMRIKGIGPKLSARLAELGVFHYRQIADWSPAQLAHIDGLLGTFQGRPERDQWQSQARLLASGDVKGYERAHGKLEPPSSGGPPA